MKGRKRGSVGLYHFVLVLVALFLLAGISHVWVNFKRTQTGYILSHLKKEILQLQEQNRKLVLEMAFLKSPRNLEKRAVKEFGLTYPSPQQIIHLP